MKQPEYSENNHVLSALGKEEYDRLRPHLEPMLLQRRKVLYKPGEQTGYIYFPTTSIIALLCSPGVGQSTAVALIGREGLVGASLCIGEEIPATSAIVQCEGRCLRAPAALVRAELARGGVLQALALRSFLSVIVQVVRCAVCNRHHKLDQQLCRWLLMTLDRSSSDRLCMTQEEIGGLLGVRREGVSHAMNRLEADGLILGNRGRIRVVNRVGLERQACECYTFVNTGFRY